MSWADDSSRRGLRYDRYMDHDDAEMATTQTESASAGPRIALFGLGTVGMSVAERLLDADWRDGLSARGHRPPSLVGIADLDLERERDLDIPEEVRQTTDLHELVAAEDIDIVIELMGGTGAAGDAVLAALAAGKHVVTANKDMLARRGKELEAAARASGAALRYEAAVMSGVPVLGPLVQELGANRVTRLRGIFNGTTNYILSTMAADARDYGDVLDEAQARGYAEADPSSDVEGLDAAYKLTLLARLAFGGWPDVDELRRSIPSFLGEATDGITGVSRVHMSAAARLGLAIKLISRAELTDEGQLRAASTPMAVSSTSALGSTAGVINVVDVDAEPVGRVTLSGPGAGGPATSSAILADVLALEHGSVSTWGQLPPASEMPVEDDLGIERGWFVAIDGLGAEGFPDAIKELALATTDEGFVTRPVSLMAMSSRLGLMDRSIYAYPILTDA